MTIKPFSPDEARAHKVHVLPPQILQAVNELLAEKYVDTGEIHITLKEVKARCRKLLGIDDMYSLENPMDSWPNSVWDFEPVYRQAGWSVNYDKPGYCETYDGFYIFKKKKD